ncbi:MAG: A24 family peptidase [Bacteroidota bacterium]
MACVVAAIAAGTDLRRGVVPNALVAASAAVGLALAVLSGTVLVRLGAALVTSAVLLGVRALGHVAFGQPGLGMGDVKLGGALALLVGWPVLWALYLAATVAAVVGLAGRATGRLARRQRVPFAPFIAAGVALALWAVPFAQVWDALLVWGVFASG